MIHERYFGFPAGAVPERTEFKINATVSFSFHEGHVRAYEAGGGTTLEFPAGLFGVISHFADWKPAASVFGAGTADDQVTVFVLLGNLIDAGILVSRRPTARADSLWTNLGAALNYYLASRTHGDQVFYGSDEIEAVLGEKAAHGRQPSAYKDVAGEFFPLPTPLLRASDREEHPFLDVLLRRRTSRAFTDEPLSAVDFADLLYLTWGSTATVRNHIGEDVFLRKTSPSGGSLHSAEVYPIVMNVAGFQSGLYHYSVRRHGLELISREDPRAWVAAACGGQRWIADCSALFLSTSVLRRITWKYESVRAFRVVLAEIGHLSQTLGLVATWLGLGAFTTAALRDQTFEQKLGLDYLEEPVILVNGAGHVPRDARGSDRPR